MLDVILVSQNFPTFQKAIIGLPISTSDHRTLFLPKFSTIVSKSYAEIYNFNGETIADFVNYLKTSNFNTVYLQQNIHDKEISFNEILQDAMKCIPRILVQISSKTRPWITPKLINLINKRWSPYRANEWTQFNKLKTMIRREIITPKKKWASKEGENKSIWKLLKEERGNNKNPLLSKNEQSKLADAINKNLSQVFTPKTDSDISHLKNDWYPNIDSNWVYSELVKID